MKRTHRREAILSRPASTRLAALAGLCALLAACATAPSPIQTASFASLPTPSAMPRGVAEDYRIGPQDKLNITVFQVADLSLEKVQVDASGRILMPLIGSITAGGRTTTEVSAEIASKLSAKYLQNPQVSVVVEEAVSQKVTVDGAVMEAGVFPLRGRTTLLQAVAMAKGPKDTANLKRVAIFREINGQRMAAVFDVAAIRSGMAADPEIVGDDSTLRSALRETVRALPALGAFAFIF